MKLRWLMRPKRTSPPEPSFAVGITFSHVKNPLRRDAFRKTVFECFGAQNRRFREKNRLFVNRIGFGGYAAIQGVVNGRIRFRFVQRDFDRTGKVAAERRDSR